MSRKITFDARSLFIDGNRRLLLSGEIHYARIPRSEWERVLDRTKESGINSVASYVFWSLHEPDRGKFDFSGRADLGAFLGLCQERGLDTILRLGPYCCAEWNYGGFPSWLRDVPGIVFRTWNGPYIECVKSYFRVLLAEIRPHLATQGGSIILAQVENEYNNIAKRYGEEGQKYIAWIVEYAKSLGLDIPTLMCEGGAPGAIESVNGYGTHASALRLRKTHPDIPLIWTENWPGWYNTWGYERHLRDAGEIGGEILRFMAVGGSGFNYYMWHGGTNFDRTAMYLQTTEYDLDSPLNEYGEPTEKSRLLRQLHHALLEHQDILLTGQRREEILPADASIFTVRWEHENQKLLASFNTSARARNLSLSGLSARKHPATSAALWEWRHEAWQPLWKSWKNPASKSAPSARWRPAATRAEWLAYTEPSLLKRCDAIVSPAPLEQLLLTHDESDYCWYATETVAAKTGAASLRLSRAGDFLYVFVNDRLVAQTEGALLEIRGPTVPASEASVVVVNPLEEQISPGKSSGYEHLFSIPLRKGRNRIAILACSMGLIKGDWQLGLPMQYERKGIWDAVYLDDKPLKNWRHYPRLMGERLRLPESSSDEFFPKAWKAHARRAALTWYLKRFALTSRERNDDFVWAFDAQGLAKGFIWINGHGLGRFWQIPANGPGADAHPPIIHLAGRDQPTQRFYRIPPAWLQPENRLVVLSESGAKPGVNSLVRRPYIQK
jgi:hypothetical protein